MACFTALYILVAHSQKKQADPHGLTLLVFVTGFVVSAISSLPFSTALYPSRLITIGILMGVSAGIGLFGVTLSARAGAPASVINTVASLSLAIPIFLALLLYHQVPKGAQSIGLLFSVLAILLLQGVSGSDSPASPAASKSSLLCRVVGTIYMALIFLGNGTAQFLQARLHHVGLGGLQSSALTMMYLAGALCSVVALFLFSGRVNPGALRYGCMVGLASYSGNFTTLHALATMPANVVFPLVICGPIVVTVLYTRFIEGFRLSRRQSWGLACGTVAVLMLTVE
jgi:drug/metabolite transporter (DMT)-like permease